MARAELTKPQRAAWRALFEAHALVLGRIDKDLEAEGVGSLSEYDVLFTLYESPGRRQRLAEVASAALISRSGLTRLLDRLERKGCIRREGAPEDRRGTYAVLTEAGVEELRRIWAVYSRGIARYFLAHLSDAEAAEVGAIFGRVRTALREDEDGTP
jgi:DNA-binding MarR family transcriptional regulator